ncbi:hypothetical protein [Brevundimonas sp.]|uniref:hypothetical protein n=1 Tax=Brevundimonas sp. TaxID=1871086 RepID=UPI0025EE910A|nr:hypothetical protein [Brevundimonas sp.]
MLPGSYFASVSGVALVGAAVVLVAQDGTAYFPPPEDQPSIICNTSFDPRKREVAVDEFYAAWFGPHLRTAEEPSLYLASLDPPADRPRTVRVSWIPSFYRTVFARVEFAVDGSASLHATRLVGLGGYDPEGVDLKMQRPLRPEERDYLVALLSDPELAAAPIVTCDLGVDGTQLVLEDRLGRDYRLYNQSSPTDGAVHMAGLYVLSLTGWDLRSPHDD